MLSPKKRMAILSRDKYTCQLCGRKGGDGVKLEIDHIIPKSKGGEDSLDNLRTLCRECNIGKGKCLDKEVYKDEYIKEMNDKVRKGIFDLRNSNGMGTLSKGTIILLSAYTIKEVSDNIINYIYNNKTYRKREKNQKYSDWIEELIANAENYDLKQLDDSDTDIIFNDVFNHFRAYIKGVMRYEGWSDLASYDSRFNYIISENLLNIDGKEGLVRKHTSMSKRELDESIEILEHNPTMEGTISYKILETFFNYN